jgi:hypothetical protein
MEHFNAPKVDLPVLTYLLYIGAIIGLVAWLFYRLMLPTIIPNPGLSAYRSPVRASTFLQITAQSPVPDIERMATEAAEDQTIKQGLERRFTVAADRTTLLPHETPTPPSPKPKRMVQKRQHVPSNPWQSVGFAQRSYGGGFWQ